MTLAQQTEALLLDEPTTFLDLAHQVEVLRPRAPPPASGGRTVVAVLHDLNQAARYADHLIAMRDGRIVAAGPPRRGRHRRPRPRRLRARLRRRALSGHRRAAGGARLTTPTTPVVARERNLARTSDLGVSRATPPADAECTEIQEGSAL